MTYADVRERMAKDREDKPTVDARRCTANGCPLWWSADMGKGRLCSWHDRAKPGDWPTITAELQTLLAAGGVPQRPVIKPSAQTLAGAARVKAHLAGRPAPANPLATAAQRISSQRSAGPLFSGLSDDEVNAMLDEVRS